MYLRKQNTDKRKKKSKKEHWKTKKNPNTALM